MNIRDTALFKGLNIRISFTSQGFLTLKSSEPNSIPHRNNLEREKQFALKGRKGIKPNLLCLMEFVTSHVYICTLFPTLLDSIHSLYQVYYQYRTQSVASLFTCWLLINRLKEILNFTRLI